MATAVLDIDVAKLPLEVTGLEQYSRALVLIRWQGRPVGQTEITVLNGRIGGTELRDRLIETAGWPLCKQWLEDYLEWDERDGTSYVPPKATVAICTRDRPEDLRRCLAAVMKLPDDGQEVLVVDNCPSSDESRQIVKNYPGVRYVLEDFPGLSAARNRALREASHEVVAFADDDTVPDSHWLRALLINFNDPHVHCVTGLTMPHELETEAQEWFEKYSPHGRGFHRRVFDSSKDDPLHVAPIGVGANFAIRRSVLKSVGSFCQALGVGSSTKGGEDYEFFSRILACGYRIVYDPAAVSWHRHRRTWKELRKTIFGYGVGVYAFYTHQLFVRHEATILLHAWCWLKYKQLPNFFRSLFRRPRRIPMDLLFAELRGCVTGPWAYLYSRWCLRSNGEG